MGFFSSVSYPTDEHPLTENEIKKLITYIHVPTLNGHEDREKLIQESLLHARHGNGTISQQKIFTVLTQLKDQNRITVYDRDAVMKTLVEYLNNRNAETRL